MATVATPPTPTSETTPVWQCLDPNACEGAAIMPRDPTSWTSWLTHPSRMRIIDLPPDQHGRSRSISEPDMRRFCSEECCHAWIHARRSVEWGA
jgi:hypothetical protein